MRYGHGKSNFFYMKACILNTEDIWLKNEKIVLKFKISFSWHVPMHISSVWIVTKVLSMGLIEIILVWVLQVFNNIRKAENYMSPDSTHFN